MIVNKKLVVISLLLVSFSACKSPEENLTDVKKQAVTDLSKAEKNVAKVQEEEKAKIAKQQGANAVGDAKIEATENIADAKKIVQDEKVEATEAVVDAEQKAKTDTSPEVP